MLIKTNLIPELSEKDKTRFWAKVDVRGLGECWEWKGGKSHGYGAFYLQGVIYPAHRVAWVLANGPIPLGKFVCHKCDNHGCVDTSHFFLGTQKDNIQDAINKGRMASGDKNGTRTHPETVARGDRHGSKTHPERIARGEKHGSKTHPEKLIRGDKHWTRIHPEKLIRGGKHWSRLHPEKVSKGATHWVKTHPEKITRGEQHGSSKLTEKQALEILVRRKNGEKLKSIASDYCISVPHVSRIVRGEAWRHLTL